MSQMDTLRSLMQQLEDQLTACMRCGMCQAVCPLYAQTGREADVARGKLALLDGLLKTMFDDPKGAARRLNKCLLCGACEANCPSGVHVMEIFLKARAILNGYLGLSPAKRLILRGLLAHPQRFDRMAQWGAGFQKLLTGPVDEVVGTSCARFAPPLLADRHMTPLAATPLHRQIPPLDTKGGRSGIKAAFYVGCLIDKFFPRVAQAGLKALAYHGVDLFLPHHQACCGIPALSSGDLSTFKELVRHNLNLFSKGNFDYLITACATCTSTIKKLWPMMLDDDSDLRSPVTSLAEKTMDISEFLVQKVGADPPSSPRTLSKRCITYHDPCHLKKSLGVWREPRRLISCNHRYILKELPLEDQCCGMGGSFNLQYYDISSNIGRLKADAIISTACTRVATGCPACMLQIADMLSTDGRRIDVKHTVEIYAESLNHP